MKKAAKEKTNAQAAARMRLLELADCDVRVEPYRMSERRRACASDFRKFCDTYLPQWFSLPHSPDQIKTLAALEHIALHSGSKAIARPRGWGKTQQSKALALWVMLYRHRRYTIAFAATSKMARKNYQSIVKTLAHNAEIKRDWPEICLPIAAAFMRPNRAKYITVNQSPCYLECSGAKTVFPTTQQLCEDGPDLSGTVLECSGVLEAARGLQHDTVDGETIRPDFAIGDDFQTKKSAKSPMQCEARIETICGDFKHMAGPDRDLAMVLNATVIESGDAADQLIDRDKHPEFDGERQQMVYQWPAREDLWKQYIALRKSGMRDGDRGKAANEFYAANRAEMDAGAAVGWDHGYKAKAGEMSTIQSAHNILADDGETIFWAECQNQPKARTNTQYEISADLICARVAGFPRLTAPAGAEIIVAGCDLNYVGANWAMLACRPDAAAYVAAWGKWPEGRALIDKDRRSGLTEAQAVAGAVVELAQYLNALQVVVGGVPRYVDCLGVDCGFLTDTVIQTCASLRMPMRVVPVRGFSSKTFRPQRNSIKRGDGWHVTDWPQGRVMSINVDHWREQMQRSFLLPAGTPGSTALYGTDPREHRQLAEEIASEILAEKVETPVAMYYNWRRKPGVPNDKGDAMVYARALADAAGASALSAEGAWRPRAAESSARPSGRRRPSRVCSQPIEAA